AAHTAAQKGEELDRAGLAASFCAAVVRELVPSAIDAAKACGYGKLAVAGGVAANSFLRAALERECGKAGIRLFIPPVSLCGDNGAMIACQGYYAYLAGHRAKTDLNAYATLSIEDYKGDLI
ncbi:MAG: tRNA (adenosine(37)-N6)-threonylcarbamoyltransferase complex transferase subunit TsaD, partial [Oscillospiraceae bacterium]|nr:tRNA (adenosine(37)-N6)-threonylcarbamoyltransferase complex transferase subunit TsaD [Oscillospiraceae bacterium]